MKIPAKLNLFRKSSALVVILLLLASSASGFVDGMKPLKPKPTDKCPVCGMFVAKYPHWLAEIAYNDGTVLFFDGTKDMFKFFFEPEKFKSDRRREDIEAIFVTEYYYMSLTGAGRVYFVVGSDVYGPMGRELIPFRTEADAREFMRDHGGEKIVLFNEVTPGLIDSLD